MQNDTRLNKAYVDMLKAKAAAKKNTVLVATDKGTFEFKELRDVVIIDGVSLFDYLKQINDEHEKEVEALRKSIAELEQKVNGAEVL